MRSSGAPSSYTSSPVCSSPFYQPADFDEVQLGTLDMHKDLTLDEMVGWVRSWSAFETYRQRHGAAAAEALLEAYRCGLAECLGAAPAGDGGAARVRTRWPILLLQCRLVRAV